jgi:hypothetical protein
MLEEPPNDAPDSPLADGYGNQREYIDKVLPLADVRQQELEAALRETFSKFIEKREVEVIIFESVSADELADAIRAKPIILKSLLACCNLAGRAIKRDLKIDAIDTYAPVLSPTQASALAGYLLSFLPPYLELPTLVRVDRVAFIDKEIRADKGRWEKLICEALNTFGKTRFKKRKFVVGGDAFELDAASPPKGEPIEIGIDVKRIEARQDIHKRGDEIVNKAAKLKSKYPKAKFGAVVYYPFVQEHSNVQNRLNSPNIDCVVFASLSADSIENAVRLLLAKLESK